MIINTGMRTDIPAFYSKWLLNRINEGYVYVRNPFFRNKVTKYRLDPNVVDCLAFCTKNPHPLVNYLSELDKFRQFWFITITPYGKEIEPNVPDKRQVIKDFKKISLHIGINSIALRYDPIIINNKYTIEYHIKCFDKLLSELSGYTRDCTISFIDLYEKVKKNAPEMREVTREEQILLAKEFVTIGKKYNIKIHGCCEEDFLKEYGVDITGCMSKEIVERAIDNKLIVPITNRKRAGCNCLLGNDIGEYNTCMHLCKYCYANFSKDLVLENIKKHNPNSPFLIGQLEENDEIHEAKQESYIDKYRQISLF